MHWCADEQFALLALLGSLPFLGPWLAGLLAKLRRPHCCKPEHRNPCAEIEVGTTTMCRFPGCRAPAEYLGHTHLTNDPAEIFPKGLGRQVKNRDGADREYERSTRRQS